MNHLRRVQRVQLTLTPEVLEILAAMAQDVTDRLGTAVGMSAVVRALARAGQAADPAFLATVTDAVEQELNAG